MRHGGKECVVPNEIRFILIFYNSWNSVMYIDIIENIKITIKKLNC